MVVHGGEDVCSCIDRPTHRVVSWTQADAETVWLPGKSKQLLAMTKLPMQAAPAAPIGIIKLLDVLNGAAWAQPGSFPLQLRSATAVAAVFGTSPIPPHLSGGADGNKRPHRPNQLVLDGCARRCKEQQEMRI